MLAILLPPSEGKAPGGTSPRWRPGSGRFGRALRSSRLEIATALEELGGGDRRLLGVGGGALDRAREANVSVVGAPTLPAWQRFTGVVWQHLDVGGLAPDAHARAADAVVVVSALAGLSALDDPLPDHRLKLSVRLEPLGRLSSWWQPTLAATLDRHLEGRLVVDLLPQEHAAAWSPVDGAFDHRRVRFVGHDGRVAGHTAKAAKGLLARALVSSDDPERVLATWRHPELRIDVD